MNFPVGVLAVVEGVAGKFFRINGRKLEMKIIISPSKTKKLNSLTKERDFKKIIFPDTTEKIIKEISGFSVEEIEKKFKLKKEQAEILLKFYRNFKKGNYGHALASYYGIAYKSINIEEFNKKDVEFAENHLVILSALYGVLTPMTGIKEYRLDMTNNIFSKKSLYEIWKKNINSYFQEEDSIINLASKEYSRVINSPNIYDFEFYTEEKGSLKQISTNSKKMRGFTVNYIIKNRITEIEKFKNIILDGYRYSDNLSSEKKYVYIKK